MEKEQFLLCDCKFTTNKNGETFYYLLIYSSYEFLEKVFISKEDFEFVVKMKNNIKIQDFLERSYNKYKQKFILRFTRK